MLRSVSIVGGSPVLSTIRVLATDRLQSRLLPGEFVRRRVPFNPPLLASTALFVVISIFCAWLCARFAPSRAGQYVLWLFIVGEIMGTAATIPNWNKGWPH